MAGEVLTVVSALVDPARRDDLAAAYQAVLGETVPDGLLASALLRGADDRWQVASLWRDRAALDAMRASAEVPAAIRVFHAAGATPTLAVFEVTDALRPA